MSKPNKYIISIQWGSGMHYFSGSGHSSFEIESGRAMVVANELQAMITSRSVKRGAVPTVYLWEMKAEIPIKRSKQ
jgi:hypothetical protein